MWKMIWGPWCCMPCVRWRGVIRSSWQEAQLCVVVCKGQVGWLMRMQDRVLWMWW